MKKRFIPIFLVAIMLICTIISLTKNSAVHAATIPQSTILYGKNLNHTDPTKMYAEGLANNWKTGQSISSTSDDKPYLDVKSYQKYAYASTDLANRDANYKNYKNLFQYIALDSSNAAIGSYANQFEALGYAYGSRLTWLNLVTMSGKSTEYKFTPVVANEGLEVEKIYIIPQYFDSNGNFTEEAPTWISSSMNTTPTSTNSKQVAFILRYDSGDTAIGASNKCVIAFEDGYHNKLSGNPHYANAGVNLNKFEYIYICYAPHEYTFNANGGTMNNNVTLSTISRYGVNSVQSQMVKYQNNISKKGYTFAGWEITLTEKNGNVVSDKQSVSFTEDDIKINGTTVAKSIYKYLGSDWFSNQLFADCTFTAKWVPNNYNINYNANGGSGTTPSTSVTFDKSFTIGANKFTRTGHTFSKWNEAANGSGTSWNQNATGTWNKTNNLTLYAQWSVNTARLDYRANGGSVSSNTYSLNSSGQILKTSGNNVYFQTVKYGTNAAPMTPSALGLSRTGYTFSKWRVHSTGTKLTAGTAYNPTTYAAYNDSSKTVSNSTGINCVLWAEWTPNTYTIEYNKNKPSSSYDDVAGTTASSSHTYDTAKNLTANGYSLKGYTFLGWNTKADGTGTSYADKASVKNLTATNGGKITLYAQWEDNSGPTISADTPTAKARWVLMYAHF